MDVREFRNCMGRFATGVTVVTYKSENENYGLTANSFTSVSLDPPLVLVSVDRKAKACDRLPGQPFTVNVLHSEQEDVAMHFAGRPKETLPFKWVEGEKSPSLDDSLATIECVPWAEYDGGDHILFLGQVTNFTYQDRDALTYFSGSFGSLPAQSVAAKS